ncbi:MAG TPA: hypothetical protein VFZ73_07595 [Gemmatimonadaceae bacterium]
MGEGHRNRAVVLGGSMAGLLAARALAEAYTEVVLLDRDDLEAASGHRRGVPQARHIHALLARGQQVLEELFPGLTAELAARGVPVGDMLGDVRQCFSGQRLQRMATGLAAVSASRPCLESAVRARVRALPGVVFTPPCDVLGLVSSPDRRRVTGVRLLRRKDGSAEEALDTDLVVDAMGRGSRTPVWLEALGYERPAEERVMTDVSYATRRYRLATDALSGDLACIQGPTPAHPRGGALARLEAGQWILTLMGLLGDHPPTGSEGFLSFARSLRYPDIHEAIRDAEPLDEAVAYRFPASVRRRYERLARFPDGLVALGDSVCSFNPIYGQGMTVAALQALALRHHLERHPTPQPRRFLRELARVLDVPWDMAAGADLVFPGVTGRRTRKLRLASAYIARVHAAAARDPQLAAAFVRVSGLVDPPDALLRPRVAVRVLRHSVRARGEHPSGHDPAASMPHAGSIHDREGQRRAFGKEQAR